MMLDEKKFNKARKSFSKKSLSNKEKNIVLSEIYKKTGTEAEAFGLGHFLGLFLNRKAIALAALILIFIGSGTAYGAVHSLPGDRLYGLKVNFIEPVGTALKFGGEARADYQMSLIEKRLDEIERLEGKGKLSEKAKKRSAEAVRRNVADLEVTAGVGIGVPEVGEIIDRYNSIISPEFKIDLNIEAEPGPGTKIPVDINVPAGRIFDRSEDEDSKEEVIDEKRKSVDDEAEGELNEDRDENPDFGTMPDIPFLPGELPIDSDTIWGL